MPEVHARTYDGALQALGLVLLFELLDLLQGEEGSPAPPHRLLWVGLAPLVQLLGVTALNMQPQVLPVLRHEVAHVAGEGFLA